MSSKPGFTTYRSKNHTMHSL